LSYLLKLSYVFAGRRGAERGTMKEQMEEGRKKREEGR